MLQQGPLSLGSIFKNRNKLLLGSMYFIFSHFFSNRCTQPADSLIGDGTRLYSIALFSLLSTILNRTNGTDKRCAAWKERFF